MVREHSAFRIGWDLLIAILVFVSCALIPWQIVFSTGAPVSGWSLIYWIDLVFLLDIGLNFVTSYRERGVEVRSPRETSRHYARTVFPVDAIANFPWELLALFADERILLGAPLLLWWRLPRLLRLVRFFVIVRRWEALPRINPGVIRIVRFGVVIMLVAHIAACSWFLTAAAASFPAGNWAEKAGIVGAAPLDQYVRSLYWTITTMTTVGFGDITPARTAEYLVAMIVMLLGASLYAFVVGSIASVLSALNAERTRYRDRLQSLMLYLQQRGVSSELHQRVRGYYDYLWAKHRGVTETELLKDLPQSLQIDIKTQVARNILQHVPLFEFCGPVLRDELLGALKLETFDPGSTVVRDGEIGRDIFFVVDGRLTVRAGEKETAIAQLEAGEYFGYLSVVLNERRTASVIADGYCDLLRLRQEDYNAIMESYPEFRDVLAKAAANKTEKMADLVLEGVVL